MTGLAAGINPAMLRWARERAGYASIADVAGRVKWPAEDIAAWESGERSPTWEQFQHLARDLYHRPTALFFFPEPPEEAAPADLFPSVPKGLLNALEPDTRLALRQAKARQLDIAELTNLNGLAAKQIVRDLKGRPESEAAIEFAAATRLYLGITLTHQFSWQSDEEAFDEWRDAVQSAGVWVFQRPFQQTEIAGFCLYDDQRPLIFLNEVQPSARRIFTLFHELAALLYGFSHLRMPAVDYHGERLTEHTPASADVCDRFASELLVPDDHFLQSATGVGTAGADANNLTTLSHQYRVSQAVIRRKYLDHGLSIPQSDDTEVRKLQTPKPSASSDLSNDGDHYAIQGKRLGVMYTELALRGYHQGAYDVDQLAEYLDIKVSEVEGLESWLSGGLSPQ